MRKFEQKDLLAFMEDIISLNTEVFQSDLEHDKVKLDLAVNSDDPSDKQLIWLCRSTGTWLFFEKDVFFKDTPRKTAILQYLNYENLDQFLLFFFQLTGKTYDGQGILADIYVYDYADFCDHLEQMAVESGPYRVFFEKGDLLYDKDKRIPDEHPQFGKFVKLEYTPKEPSQLKFVLTGEKKQRRKAIVASMDRYVAQLAKKRNMPLPKNYITRNNTLKGSAFNA